MSHSKYRFARSIAIEVDLRPLIGCFGWRVRLAKILFRLAARLLRTDIRFTTTWGDDEN